jgi:hypothetical protein
MWLASERIYRYISIVTQEQNKTEKVCGGMGTYAKSDIGGIGRLLEEVPEDLPRRNVKAVTPTVVPADVHDPDEAALLAIRNRKCSSQKAAVELLIVLLAGDLSPALPVFRHFDEPRFQMSTARTITIRADCVVSWHNPPLLEIIAYPIVPRVRNIFFFLAKS